KSPPGSTRWANSPAGGNRAASPLTTRGVARKPCTSSTGLSPQRSERSPDEVREDVVARASDMMGDDESNRHAGARAARAEGTRQDPRIRVSSARHTCRAVGEEV